MAIPKDVLQRQPAPCLDQYRSDTGLNVGFSEQRWHGIGPPKRHLPLFSMIEFLTGSPSDQFYRFRDHVPSSAIKHKQVNVV